ncbi:hypothetical protein TRVL_09221 [Trypanosoma vivax]|nr:hypothetical protein TRVL_09221 [Trypanosoma vivax]
MASFDVVTGKKMIVFMCQWNIMKYIEKRCPDISTPVAGPIHSQVCSAVGVERQSHKRRHTACQKVTQRGDNDHHTNVLCTCGLQREQRYCNSSFVSDSR